MKKTVSASLNLKFLRIPLAIFTFFLVLSLISKLCITVPELRLNKSTVTTLLRLSAVPTEKSGYSSVFSLARLVPIVQTKPEKEENPSHISPPDKAVTADSTKKVKPAEIIKISNRTDYNINPSDFLSGKPAFLSGNVSVLVVHTHTTESYTQSENFRYTPTDTDRTTDKNRNMVLIGKEISKILTKNGIATHHDTTINDYPSYNGSYARSGKNVKNAITNDPSIKIVLDVHRDALENSNKKYTFTHSGKTGAQVMLVVGSNLSGLSHESWKTNMQFAATLQAHTDSMYPDLMRPINFRSERFNQQLAPGAIIVEVGTNGNTFEEALFGAQCFAEALADYLLQNK